MRYGYGIVLIFLYNNNCTLVMAYFWMKVDFVYTIQLSTKDTMKTVYLVLMILKVLFSWFITIVLLGETGNLLFVLVICFLKKRVVVFQKVYNKRNHKI